jgi:hypothetical protein
VKWIVAWGDVVEGFNFDGPFDTEEDAERYAETWNLGHYPKTVAELSPPRLGGGAQHPER